MRVTQMLKTGSWFVLGYLLLSSSAAAQCGQWDFSGKWEIWISRTKAVERLDLAQSGSTVSGTARLFTPVDPYKDGGKVTGNVQGDKVSISIDWINDRSIIRESFTGTVAQDGKFSGQASVWALAGSVETDWASSRPMQCLFKTVKKLDVKPSSPAAPPVSATKAPYIIATPNNIALPFGVQVGQSTIVWDAGKDHPYAEIWVKVDSQDERKVLEMGKGSLPIVIEPGRTYVYILTDAGTTLATVTVRFLR